MPPLTWLGFFPASFPWVRRSPSSTSSHVDTAPAADVFGCCLDLGGHGPGRQWWLGAPAAADGTNLWWSSEATWLYGPRLHGWRLGPVDLLAPASPYPAAMATSGDHSGLRQRPHRGLRSPLKDLREGSSLSRYGCYLRRWDVFYGRRLDAEHMFVQQGLLVF